MASGPWFIADLAAKLRFGVAMREAEQLAGAPLNQGDITARLIAAVGA
ncbi:hypothetical protein U8P68_11070 [Rhizobium ruizarguesonis]|jgi:hypothetical protein|nr:hypothetical protein [Rhizobium leguminosarum]WSH59857.1 hypothetical protein U8P68_11070 [Rhizobium ruizarguesonis]